MLVSRKPAYYNGIHPLGLALAQTPAEDDNHPWSVKRSLARRGISYSWLCVAVVSLLLMAAEEGERAPELRCSTPALAMTMPADPGTASLAERLRGMGEATSVSR
jgi:hypothetical protein